MGVLGQMPPILVLYTQAGKRGQKGLQKYGFLIKGTPHKIKELPLYLKLSEKNMVDQVAKNNFLLFLTVRNAEILRWQHLMHQSVG